MKTTVRLKLVLAFNLFLLALALTGYLTYRELDRSGHLSSEISTDLMSRVEHSGRLSWQISRMRSLQLAYILAADDATRADITSQFSVLRTDIDNDIAAYRATASEGTLLQGLRQVETRYSAFAAQHDQIIALADQGRSQEAIDLYGDSNPQFQELSQSADNLFHISRTETRSAAESVNSMLDRAKYVIAGGLLAAALLIVAVGHPLSTSIHRRLQSLLEGIGRVSRGELDDTIPARGSDEIADVTRAFNSMIDSLKEARDEVGDLHGRALRMQEERIALLQSRVAQVVTAQEEERRRVARELHDQAGQVLTALQLGLSRLQMMAPSPELEQQAASLREMALEAMSEVRNLALDLRPSALDELGLPGALQDYVHTFSERTGITAALKLKGTPRRLPAEQEVTLFRIVQEGLTNAAKHSQAKTATVRLAFANPSVEVSVEDDGAGFDVDLALGAEQYKSLGLLGIQERCQLIGADFQIDSHPGEGTKLTVTLTEPRTETQTKPPGLEAS